MPLTIYEKELIRILRTRCGELTTGQTVEKLVALGVIDKRDVAGDRTVRLLLRVRTQMHVLLHRYERRLSGRRIP